MGEFRKAVHTYSKQECGQDNGVNAPHFEKVLGSYIGIGALFPLYLERKHF